MDRKFWMNFKGLFTLSESEIDQRIHKINKLNNKIDFNNTRTNSHKQPLWNYFRSSQKFPTGYVGEVFLFGSQENDDVFTFCVCSHGDGSCNLMLTNMVGA